MNTDEVPDCRAVWRNDGGVAVDRAPAWFWGWRRSAGLAEAPTLTSIITARQPYTPVELLGQVSTTGASLEIDGFAIGAAVDGLLVTHYAPTTSILPVGGVPAGRGGARGARRQNVVPGPEFLGARR